MIYEYNISTNTIWTSFDYGEVEADSIEEAREKATQKIRVSLEIANLLLSRTNYTIEMDLTQLEVTLKK